ncbi:hypothetical protein J2Y41_003857 [Arthrobacter sp. 1088]|nr:hypothetical protein [Arthrobacter sp. 1088]
MKRRGPLLDELDSPAPAPHLGDEFARVLADGAPVECQWEEGIGRLPRVQDAITDEPAVRLVSVQPANGSWFPPVGGAVVLACLVAVDLGAHGRLHVVFVGKT